MSTERFSRIRLVVLSLLAGCAFSALCAAPAIGADDSVEFLHALQQQGYGETAIEYLKGRKEAGTLDGPLAEAYDAEMAASLRAAARETRDDGEALRRLAAASEHVRNCLKRDPRGLTAARLVAISGQIEVDRAVMLAARVTSDADIAQSRAALLVARDSFSRAVAICQEMLRILPAEAAQPPARPQRGKPRNDEAARQQEQRREAESLLTECRMNIASVDLKLALSYADRNDPQREKCLRSAAQGFDGVFQENRGRRVGLVAHLWHAKTLEALGDRQTAIDVLDEVLVNAPKKDQPRGDAALEEIFAEAERLRLAILAAQDAIEQVAQEAGEWLEANPPAEKTAAYGAIRLEQAKALILLAARKKSDQLLQDAVNALADAAKSPGPHQREALLLEDRYAAKGAKGEMTTIKDAAAMGDAAANAGVWDKAIAAYERALELGKSAAKPDELAAIRFRLARARSMAGQWEAAAQEAEEIARQNPQHPQAPAAAALAVRSLSVMLEQAKDRAPMEAKMADLIALMAKEWPDRPDADEARLALAEAAITRGDHAGAMKTAELAAKGVHCRREAWFLMAQIHWQSYLAEKKKAAGKRDEAAMLAQRRAAVHLLEECAQEGANDNSAARNIAQRARLLSAEFQLEAGEPEKAIKTLEPLESALGDRSAMSATLASRMLKEQLLARLMLRDAKRAGEAALRLTEIGDDTPATNGLLADALRAQSDAIKSRQEPAAEEKGLLKDLAERLTARKNHTLAGLAAIADACAELGDTDHARACYDEILKRADVEQDTGPGAKAAVASARGWRAATLRREKKYEEALREADRLVKENPQLAEPLMEKGRVLQEWAESKPALYDDALAVWTSLRLRMARMPTKPPEYYEAVYNAAVCLVQKNARGGDAAGLAEARQLLKSAMVLSPELDSPERVAKYKALLEKTRFLEKHRLTD